MASGYESQEPNWDSRKRVKVGCFQENLIPQAVGHWVVGMEEDIVTPGSDLGVECDLCPAMDTPVETFLHA